MSIDLHVHSTASDGTLSPEALVREAADLGLSAIAISDHDSVEGVSAALEEAATTGVRVVPALELSVSVDGRDLHILGYKVDHTDPKLLSRLEEFREARQERAVRMMERLRAGGSSISDEDLAEIAGCGAVGRAHIARALVAAGEAATMRDAFERLIGKGRPCYVAKAPVPSAEAIDLIRSVGGVPVLAHPGVSKVDDLIPRLVDEGVMGLEAWHTEQSAEDTVRYRRIAEDSGLLVTGGTDFHSARPGVTLGGIEMPDDVLERLLAAKVT